jgi:hypothetical protein
MEYSYALRVQFHQRSHPDATYRDGFNHSSAKGLQGLAHTMGVVLVSIGYLFHGARMRIHYDKAGGRTKMFVDSALKSLQRFNRKTDFHYSSPCYFKSEGIADS